MKKIVLTGGGTAGHVTPNIAMIPELRRGGYEIHYVGTADGIERQLISREGVEYHHVPAGKLRRYFDLKNLSDLFKIAAGFVKSVFLIRKIRPDVLFSKGGFVSCPVVWAAWLNRVPVIIHESDITPGLANKLSMPFSKKICYAFPETKNYLPSNKSVFTGIPVRRNLLMGDAAIGRRLCGFTDEKPSIVLIGGSLGSEVLNKSIRSGLEKILEKFNICHICGKGGADESLKNVPGYRQFEYLNDELPHVFALADVIISRAGATTLFEILALKKPNVLVPLSKKASRGDQILNARSFKAQGYSEVIEEESLSFPLLYETVCRVFEGRGEYIKRMGEKGLTDSCGEIVRLITEISK